MNFKNEPEHKKAEKENMKDLLKTFIILITACSPIADSTTSHSLGVT